MVPLPKKNIHKMSFGLNEFIRIARPKDLCIHTCICYLCVRNFNHSTTCPAVKRINFKLLVYAGQIAMERLLVVT